MGGRVDAADRAGGPLRSSTRRSVAAHRHQHDPGRAWLDGYDQAWELLGVRARYAGSPHPDGRDRRASSARLVPWLTARPMRALELADALGPSCSATVRWIDERQQPGMYLRQVDVPGVDTKFIERHRGVLADLLDLQLDRERIDAGLPQSDFAGRYRFRRKPGYVRFRLLSNEE